MKFQKGQIPWNKGKHQKRTEEQISKQKATLILRYANGLIPGMLGKKMSDETIKKMSDSAKKAGASPQLRAKRSFNSRKENLSEETLKKRSAKLVGINNPFYGRKHSEQAKTEMSKLKFGKTSPRKGVQITDETRQKISGENSCHWLGGISFEPYCHKFNEQLKERIRDRDNRTCQYPGCEKKENGRKHTCHHVHYDKPNCDPDLITLCVCCNAKVNSNREHWEAYFMEKLKERGLLYGR